MTDCRYATDEHTVQDLRGTLRALATRWRWLLDAVPADVVAEPLAATAAAVGADVVSLDAIDRCAAAVDDAHAFDVVHATEHALADAGRASAHLVASHTGTVAGVFTSRGGVPKLPVEAATVGRRGVEGDRQAERRHHGRVTQALCLWSGEVIDALAGEGHPIGPGAAGENVLVRGIDWTVVRPGVRLQLGTVLAEVSGFALPCRKNARWFAGGDFRRIDPDRFPGWSRAYAIVVEDGAVRAGDDVVVEPGVSRG